jgi:perosamine synthetase
MPQFKIPVYQPSLTGNERKYVLDCLDSTWISSKGRFIPEFEAEFCRYTGCSHAATVCNGTVALHLALVALGIEAGDEVIVPTLTYVASVNAIAYCGATPIFVDSDPETWQMDVRDVARKLSPRTKAIMPVHLYGHPCDMDPLVELARARTLFVVEDCAEALGALYKGKHVGAFSDVATYSFYGNKTVTSGEGGMVTTRNQTLHERLMHLKGQGLALYREYWHDVIGYNYRMTNICAAIGLAQLERVESLLQRKRAIAQWYREELKELPVVAQPEKDDVRHSYWMVSILVDAEHRDPLRSHMAKSGIETRPLFSPVHTMPMYARKYEHHPVAEDLARRGVNLPSWPDLEQGTVRDVCACIGSYFKSA